MIYYWRIKLSLTNKHILCLFNFKLLVIFYILLEKVQFVMMNFDVIVVRVIQICIHATLEFQNIYYEFISFQNIFIYLEKIQSITELGLKFN